MIINVLKNHSVGSRLYSEGVQYEVDDEVGKALIASGDAEAVVTEMHEEDEPLSEKTVT